MSDYQNYANSMECMSRVSEDIAEEAVKRARQKALEAIEKRMGEIYNSAMENYKSGTKKEIDNLDGIINNKQNDKDLIEQSIQKKQHLEEELQKAIDGRELRLTFDKKLDLKVFVLEAQKQGMFVSAISAGADQYHAVISSKDRDFVDKFVEDHNSNIKEYSRDEMNFLIRDNYTSGNLFYSQSISGSKVFNDVINGHVERLKNGYNEEMLNIEKNATDEINKEIKKNDEFGAKLEADRQRAIIEIEEREKRLKLEMGELEGQKKLPDNATKIAMLSASIGQLRAEADKDIKRLQAKIDSIDAEKSNKKTQLEKRIAEIQKDRDKKIGAIEEKIEDLDNRIDSFKYKFFTAERVSYNAGSTGYDSYMQGGIYTTEAGRSQQKVGRKVRSVSNWIIQGSRFTTKELRLQTWNDLSRTQREIRNATTSRVENGAFVPAKYTVDKDKKVIDPATGKEVFLDTTVDDKYKVGARYKQYKTPLDNVNVHKTLATVGAMYGIDLINSKNITHDAFEIRDKLLKKYEGVVRLDRKGNIDQDALLKLMSNKSFGKKEGIDIPTAEEAKFLTMTMQGNNFKKPHVIRDKMKARAMSNIDGMEDMEKLRARAKQSYKVVKSGALMTKQIKYRINEMNIGKTKNLLENANNLSDKKKQKLQKKLDKHNAKNNKQPSYVSTRIQAYRRWRVKGREKRQNWFYNHTAMGRVMRRGNELKQGFKKSLANSKVGKGIGKFRALKTKLLLIGAAGVITLMILSATLTGIGGAISVITSFFEPSPESTVAYKCYDILRKTEEKWCKMGMERDLEGFDPDNTSGILWWENLNFQNLKFTQDFVDINTYLASHPDGKYFYYNESEDELYLNPFCLTIPSSGDISEYTDYLTEIDDQEDFEESLSNWTVIPAGSSAHTSNIKDILCMMDVMYGLDSNTASDSWLSQNSTDSVFIFGVKDMLQSLWNRIKCIGNIFNSSIDPYEDETVSYSAVRGYCKTLFAVGHQEVMEFNYKRLPVFNSASAAQDELNAHHPVCPGKEGGFVGSGCKEEEFWFDDSGTIYIEIEANGVKKRFYPDNVVVAPSSKCIIVNNGQYDDGTGNHMDDVCIDGTWADIAGDSGNYLVHYHNAEEMYNYYKSSDCWDEKDDEEVDSDVTYVTSFSVPYDKSPSDCYTLPADTEDKVYKGSGGYYYIEETKTTWHYSTSAPISQSLGSHYTNPSAPSQAQPNSSASQKAEPTPVGVPEQKHETYASAGQETYASASKGNETYAKKGDKKATATPKPTSKPKATATPKPTSKPKATATPKPTSKPKATATPKPTQKPKATATPKPTSKPSATSTPKPTQKPSATNSPTSVVYAPTQVPTVSGGNSGTGSENGGTSATSAPTATDTPTPTPEPTTYYVYKTVTVTKVDPIVHECEGHNIAYCGGHCGLNITGFVYSFSTEQIEGGEEGTTTSPKLDGASYKVNYSTPVDAATSGSYNPLVTTGLNLYIDGTTWKNTDTCVDGVKEKVKFCQDIFDCDLLIKYGSNKFPCKYNFRNYKGWNSENMGLALLKYTQNWMDIYKFDIPENIGMGSLNGADINAIVEGVRAKYGSLSEDREKAIRLALSCVGNGNYSMDHHWHGYFEKEDNGIKCNITDCSGYVSYIFRNWSGETRNDKLSGICATDGLSNGQPKFLTNYGGNWMNVKPADAIIHFTGATSSAGGGSHALLYIGMVGEEITLSNGAIIAPDKPITTECRHFDGQGNIWLTGCYTSDSPIQYNPGSYIANPDNIVYIRPFE